MADACNCLTCQATTMLKAEADRRGGEVDANEIVTLAVDLLAAVLQKVPADLRPIVAFTVSASLSAKLKQMDAAAGGIAPTHEPEARVQ